ncbi:MAG: hypothetical protein ACJ0GH_03400 [Alphaproteobacteria bacterium]
MKLLRYRIILFVTSTLLVYGCQLTQSTDEIKGKIKDKSISVEENIPQVEAKVSKINKPKTQEKQEKQEKPVKSEGFFESKEPKDEKRILDFFSDFFGSDEEKDKLDEKNEKSKIEKNLITKPNVEKNDLNNERELILDEKKDEQFAKKDEKANKAELNEFYAPEKPKDEKRILDFFTKMFKAKENENDLSDEKVLDEGLENISKVDVEKKIILKEPLPKSEDYRAEKSTSDEMDTMSGTVMQETYEDDFYEDEDDFYEEVKDKDVTVEDEDVTKKNENFTEENEDLDDVAYFDIKKQTEKRNLKKKVNNLIGLLLPLTGEKRSAGNLVLNTFRYTLAIDPKDIVFKIYDTKGTKSGVINAAQKGINDGVDIFIGPIFSYETAELKKNFGNKKDITFFSLSPDLNNLSSNIVVSGQNTEDQISCILDDLKNKSIKKLLLIKHDDKYGEIVKNILEENLENFGPYEKFELDFLTVHSQQDLNKDIKLISDFEKRKLQLKEQRKVISEDKTLLAGEKKAELKKLERQLTFGVPFDSIIIASQGNKLLEILSHLAFYDINANNTFIYGTSLWEDTDKKDKLFANTFFVTNLKNKGSTFIKNYKDVFSKDPTSVNFHLFDLIDLVDDFKLYEIYPDNKIHIGEFTNSLVKSGSLKRETFIKKYKANGRIENVFSCQLNAI